MTCSADSPRSTTGPMTSRQLGTGTPAFWRSSPTSSARGRASAYVEFRVGPDEDELGLIDRRYSPPGAPRDPGGAIMHWHVDDVSAAVARLLELGATEYQPVTEREAGFVTASVVDPFGNIVGLMHSPHFLEMHARQ